MIIGMLIATLNGDTEETPSTPVTPDAPTSGVVDDDADTFAFTLNPSFSLSQHEYSINGGAYSTVTANPIVVGDIDVPIGQLLVRVKAIGINPPSATLSNATAFNAIPVAVVPSESGKLYDPGLPLEYNGFPQAGIFPDGTIWGTWKKSGSHAGTGPIWFKTNNGIPTNPTGGGFQISVGGVGKECAALVAACIGSRLFIQYQDNDGNEPALYRELKVLYSDNKGVTCTEGGSWDFGPDYITSFLGRPLDPGFNSEIWFPYYLYPPVYAPLTSGNGGITGTNINFAANFYGKYTKADISSNHTITVGGQGKRGRIVIKHLVAGTTITNLPGNSSAVTWATGVNEVTRLTYTHNGTSFTWTSEIFANEAAYQIPSIIGYLKSTDGGVTLQAGGTIRSKPGGVSPSPFNQKVTEMAWKVLTKSGVKSTTEIVVLVRNEETGYFTHIHTVNGGTTWIEDETNFMYAFAGGGFPCDIEVLADNKPRVVAGVRKFPGGSFVGTLEMATYNTKNDLLLNHQTNFTHEVLPYTVQATTLGSGQGIGWGYPSIFKDSFGELVAHFYDKSNLSAGNTDDRHMIYQYVIDTTP